MDGFRDGLGNSSSMKYHNARALQSCVLPKSCNTNGWIMKLEYVECTVDRNLKKLKSISEENDRDTIGLRFLFVKLVFRFVLFDVVPITFLKIFGQDDVAVFPDSLHSSLYEIRSKNKILISGNSNKICLRTKCHGS